MQRYYFTTSGRQQDTTYIIFRDIVDNIKEHLQPLFAVGQIATQTTPNHWAGIGTVMHASSRRNQIAIWTCLGLLILPGLNCLLYLTDRFRLGDLLGIDLLSGDYFIALVARLGPILDKDLGLLKIPDAIPFLIAAFLVRLLPNDRSLLLKAVAILVCAAGYLVYVSLSDQISGEGSVALRTLLESELFSKIQLAEEREKAVDLSSKFLSNLVDGLRYIFLIVGGAFFGLKIENLKAGSEK